MDLHSPNKLIATKSCFLILGDGTGFFFFLLSFFTNVCKNCFRLLLLLFLLLIIIIIIIRVINKIGRPRSGGPICLRDCAIIIRRGAEKLEGGHYIKLLPR